MRRFHALLDSPALGRAIHVWVYGHWGQPVVVFPSAAGFAHEWEAQGMIAALFALKQPETFRWALCMSGRYRMTFLTGGFSNLEIYLSNPLAFVPNLEGAELERVRRHTFLTLVCGQGPWEEGCIEETQELADWCERKGIPHERDIWGHDSAHQWDWWRRQAMHHFGRRFGG